MEVYYKMTKSEYFYFTDSIFELELNLHNIRRELILMIEEFEKQDCFVCLQLKCRCLAKSPVKDDSVSGRASGDAGNISKDSTPNKAPPADSLPKPKFEKEAVESLTVSKEGNKDIEAWIEASKCAQITKADRRIPSDVLLASLKKSWSDSRCDVKKERILEDFKKERFMLDTRFSAANAVEVFFNRFKVQPAVTAANMAFITNVAVTYAHQKSKGSEYSYF